MAGQIVSQGGANLEAISNLVEQTNDRQDRIFAQAAANQLAQRQVTAEFDPDTGFRNVREGNAVGKQFIDKYTQANQDSMQSLRESLPNDNARRYFDQHADVLGLQFKHALLSHQAAETQTFNTNTDNATINGALSAMARDPMSGVTTDSGQFHDGNLPFMQGMSQIEGTVDAMARRNGWIDPKTGEPNAIAASYKQKLTDAAYETRIQAVIQGQPGRPGDPIAAEKLFRNIQDQLGPAARLQVASEVQKASDNLTIKNYADTKAANGFTMLPSTIAPFITGRPLAGAEMAGAVTPIIRDMESGGRDYDANGNILTSDKGAKGAMQVLGSTADSPGLGVPPARRNPDGSISVAELNRVGVDTISALVRRYNDPAAVFTSYNAGFGNFDDWVTGRNDAGHNKSGLKIGFPPTGQGDEAMQAWIAKIPFKETRDYVAKGIAKYNAATAQTAPTGNAPGFTNATAQVAQAEGYLTPPPRAPTSHEMEAQIPTALADAREWARQMFPGDPGKQDLTVSQVAARINERVNEQRMVERGRDDTILAALNGPAGDGKNAPTNETQLRAVSPQVSFALDNATPEMRHAVNLRLAQGEKGWDQAGLTLYQQQLGAGSGEGREDWAKDFKVSDVYGKMPDAGVHQLIGLQSRINDKDAKEQAKSMALLHATAVADRTTFNGIGMGQLPESAPQSMKAPRQALLGRLYTAMEDFKAASGKNPTDEDIRKIANNLTATVTVPRWFGLSSAPARMDTLTPEQEEGAKAQVPDEWQKALSKNQNAKFGYSTPETINQEYILWQRHPDKNNPEDKTAQDKFIQQMRANAAKYKKPIGATGQW